jgi:hypothetical protein
MYYEEIPTLLTWKNDTSILRKSASGNSLNKLDAELDNYQKAFSPMAKRNLLTDMNYHIRKWETLNGTAVSFHPNVVALKEAIARELKALSPGDVFKYRQAICLGMDFACVNPMTSGYVRFSNNDLTDMQRKCKVMMAAIKQAQSMVAASGVDNDETLKIFMAPEFYFRGVNGAYSFEVASQILPQMEQEGASKSNYQNWLFVFGTAVAASLDEITYCTVCNRYTPDAIVFNRDPNSPLHANGLHSGTKAVCAKDPTHKVDTGSFGAEVTNIALIKKGADTHTVVKEYVSGVDYAKNEVNLTWLENGAQQTTKVNVVPPQGSNTSRIVSKFQDERMGGGVFTIDGITFGLEVCLDHAKSPSGTGVPGRMSEYANSIQILLIPSCGMNIMFESCIQNGIIFNVDGEKAGSSDVVIKGNPVHPASKAAAVPSGSGKVEMFGPFPIPRRV